MAKEKINKQLGVRVKGSEYLEIEDAKIYNMAAMKYHGEFACLNTIF